MRTPAPYCTDEANMGDQKNPNDKRVADAPARPLAGDLHPAPADVRHGAIRTRTSCRRGLPCGRRERGGRTRRGARPGRPVLCPRGFHRARHRLQCHRPGTTHRSRPGIRPHRPDHDHRPRRTRPAAGARRLRGRRVRPHAVVHGPVHQGDPGRHGQMARSYARAASSSTPSATPTTPTTGKASTTATASTNTAASPSTSSTRPS